MLAAITVRRAEDAAKCGAQVAQLDAYREPVSLLWL
jgi:hypothetical protein